MGDVYIANLNPGEVRNEYHASLIQLILHDLKHNQRVHCYVPRQAGGCLGIFRNTAVEHFLNMTKEEPSLEWLLFLDSDIVLEPDTLDRLLETAEDTGNPVIAGLYYMPLDGSSISPSIFDWKKEEDGLHHMVVRPDVPANTTVTCDGTGAGCILIHRDLLWKLLDIHGPPAAWFYESVLDGVSLGEDFTFCLRVRELGYPIIVHTGITVGHVKSTVYTKENK